MSRQTWGVNRRFRKWTRQKRQRAKQEEKAQHEAEGGGYSPTWHRKHGSWHSRQLHKMHLRTWKLLRKGASYENGWGSSWNEVQALAQEFERLSQAIAYRKSAGIR